MENEQDSNLFADQDYIPMVVDNLVEESLVINLTCMPDSSIMVESNYNILSCIVESDDGESYNIQISDLLVELRSKFGGNQTNEPCFPSNPLRVDFSQYIDLEIEENNERIGNVNWCNCNNCVPMSTSIESICCLEVENAIPYVTNHTCIIDHEYFRIFCQRADTVIILRVIGQVMNPPLEKAKNRLHRKTAYRAFTAWVHGYLGMGNRRPIPSCVVHLVRSAFPDPNNEYMGYKASNDGVAEFMAFE
ncbi:P2X purinoceptor 7-like [Engystomops pustulosus]|uniref:P2X purinoceptor 7-like n=1 Tax=Engystomops pustulosus TaxID=76066 RepID=UPI003AFB38A2